LGGIYEFTMGVDGTKVMGRYAFIYIKEDGHWKIMHNHSSVMPEARRYYDRQGGNCNSSAKPSSTSGTTHWLREILRPLPTATPRKPSFFLLSRIIPVQTDYESIKDYFVEFLLLKPQGKILESNVESGTNLAQDAGIYEFTIGKDGYNKVTGVGTLSFTSTRTANARSLIATPLPHPRVLPGPSPLPIFILVAGTILLNTYPPSVSFL
jgi:hypothetical protein